MVALAHPRAEEVAEAKLVDLICGDGSVIEAPSIVAVAGDRVVGHMLGSRASQCR